MREVPQTPFAPWQDFLETASTRADARVVVYAFVPAANGQGHASLDCPVEDSHSLNSRDVCNDPIAQRAADARRRRGRS